MAAPFKPVKNVPEIRVGIKTTAAGISKGMALVFSAGYLAAAGTASAKVVGVAAETAAAADTEIAYYPAVDNAVFSVAYGTALALANVGSNIICDTSGNCSVATSTAGVFRGLSTSGTGTSTIVYGTFTKTELGAGTQT